ncbi:MAG: ATP-dependent Clp protease ATP-binding subunit, partial [Clostridiales bacterium]|nr:ATP-dependent Clp protease ATP-binding subunit [Clostridiales bacterium]
MQPTLCSKCHKNVAVVFITKIENNESKNEGLCLKCAKELGIKPVDDMIQRLGISDDDLDGLTSEMMNAFGGPEAMESLPEISQQEDNDDEDDEGKTATFPFLNKLFNSNQPPREGGERRQESREKDEKKKENRPQKLKYLENYCVS